MGRVQIGEICVFIISDFSRKHKGRIVCNAENAIQKRQKELISAQSAGPN